MALSEQEKRATDQKREEVGDGRDEVSSAIGDGGQIAKIYIKIMNNCGHSFF